MSKIKLGFIGAGTASIATIISIVYTLKKSNLWSDDFELYCLHDPNINTLPVGEGLSPLFANMLLTVLDYEYDKNNIQFDETLRFGGKYFWNKAIGKDFDVLYPFSPGLHVNAAKFAPWCINKFKKLYKNFYEIHDNVIETVNEKDKAIIVCEKDKYEYDFVFDCRGFPSDQELDSGEYGFPKNEYVNSVLLYQDFKFYNEQHTTHYVHENGWLFGVPLQHRKAFGYLYNRSMIDKDKALDGFKKTLKEYINLENIDEEKIKSLKWRQYYKKNMMKDRILSVGNRLYFFDPHHGLPLHYAIWTASTFTARLIDFISNKISLKDINILMNNHHKINIKKVEDILSINYMNSNIENDYWKTMTQKAKLVILDSKMFISWYDEVKYKNICNTDTKQNFNYGSHHENLMYQYLNGYNIDLDKLYYD